SCSIPGDCCTRVCDVDASMCVCIGAAGTCVVDANCCSGLSCIGGACQAACTSNGNACSAHSDCCSGNCDGLAPIGSNPGTCAACISGISDCTGAASCCSGACTGVAFGSVCL